jgi:hypothetical protein
MRVALASLACLALLALAPAAQAAQRYAAPAGSGAECTQAKPCSLNEAMSKAKANDEVIITSGAYTLSAPATLSFEATGANVHGDLNGARPTISGAVPGIALAVFTPKSRLSYVDMTNSAEGAAAIGCATEVTVERVIAKTVSKTGQGLAQLGSCSVRDSLIRAEGSEAVALFASCEKSEITRNVTAIASGAKAVGVRVSYNGFMIGGACVLDLRNAIASGDLYDLQTNFGGPFGPGNITVENSNFDVAKQEPSTTITQGAGNQTAPPLFVDAAAGNYRELAGSPTIDAGIASQIGSLDLDGNARVLGAAPDIGAYEFVPPAVVPPAPGQIQSLSLAPRGFRAVNAGEAIFSAEKKKKAPIGTTVTYSISAAGPVGFSVERRLPGRKVGKRCVKQTRANRTKKRCSRFKPVKGGFTHSGQAGANSFKFSGRLNGKGLKPGRYRLVGKTGSVSRTASFRIVR